MKITSEDQLIVGKTVLVSSFGGEYLLTGIKKALVTEYEFHMNRFTFEDVQRYFTIKDDTEEACVHEMTRRGFCIKCLCRPAKQKRWKPAYDEKYWYISEFGGVRFSRVFKSSVHGRLYKFGNCFKTRREAREASKKIRQLLTQGT